MKSLTTNCISPRRRRFGLLGAFAVGIACSMHPTNAFMTSHANNRPQIPLFSVSDNQESPYRTFQNAVSTFAAASILSLSLSLPAVAENELAAKYGGGLDTSLVDQTCLINQCATQSTACLKDDPDCRKGLTCTAKCLGDNACITGCMARYGNKNLDNLLKCTIEDNECIKVAILDGGADKFGEEPKAPAPTVQNFDPRSLEGSWYKVAGYNPNYDCYACQRNTFSRDGGFQNDKLQVDVEFSMPRLLPDGSPPPPSGARELLQLNGETLVGSQSIGLNDYNTRETMVFDNAPNELERLIRKGPSGETSYARTAHSEGEMFGLSKYSFPLFRPIRLKAS